MELNIKNQKSLSGAQEKALRRRMSGVGRFLTKTDSGWALDFSKSPLMKSLIFCSVALYRPFVSPDDSEDPSTYPTARFVSQKIGYMFRDDKGVNTTAGFLRKQVSAKTIRGRIKGDKDGKLLSQYETHLRSSGLVNDDFYSYLKSENGHLRPDINQYIPLYTTIEVLPTS